MIATSDFVAGVRWGVGVMGGLSILFWLWAFLAIARDKRDICRLGSARADRATSGPISRSEYLTTRGYLEAIADAVAVLDGKKATERRLCQDDKNHSNK